MKIGIMGGTFNPIHNGHLTLASTAKKAADLDEIWFMPSGLPAHKSNAELILPEQRLAMVELAIGNIAGFQASSFEIDRPGFTYTADTMEALTKEFPQYEFFFIIGGDSLMKFHHWVRPEVISKHTTLLAAGRNGIAKETLKEQAEKLYQSFGTRVQLIDMPELIISSQQIRALCKQEQFDSIQKFLPQKVSDYIKEHALYR